MGDRVFTYGARLVAEHRQIGYLRQRLCPLGGELARGALKRQPQVPVLQGDPHSLIEGGGSHAFGHDYGISRMISSCRGSVVISASRSPTYMLISRRTPNSGR